MAETWRSMDETGKDKFMAVSDDEEETDLPPKEKKRRIFKVARRLQGDVSPNTVQCIVHAYIHTCMHVYMYLCEANIHYIYRDGFINSIFVCSESLVVNRIPVFIMFQFLLYIICIACKSN